MCGRFKWLVYGKKVVNLKVVGWKIVGNYEWVVVEDSEGSVFV